MGLDTKRSEDRDAPMGYPTLPVKLALFYLIFFYRLDFTLTNSIVATK